VANNNIIGHFSFLLLLGLAQFHDRKPIFRGALYSLFKLGEALLFRREQLRGSIKKVFYIPMGTFQNSFMVNKKPESNGFSEGLL